MGKSTFPRCGKRTDGYDLIADNISSALIFKELSHILKNNILYKSSEF
jgi:hypothetical protein